MTGARTTSPPLSPRRWRVGAGATLLIAVVLVAPAGCGGGSSGAGASTDTTEASGAVAAAGSSQAPRPTRPGCGQSCGQLGAQGIDVTSAQKPAVSVDTTDPVAPLGGSAIPVTVTCRFSQRCRGYVDLRAGDAESGGRWLGGTELDLAAGEDETVAVPLAASARRRLAKAGAIGIDAEAVVESLSPTQYAEWVPSSHAALVIAAPHSQLAESDRR